MVTKRLNGNMDPTEEEIRIFDIFCANNQVNREDRSGIELATYMLQTWNVNVTEESLSAALPVLVQSGAVKIYTPAEQTYRSVAAEDPERANKLHSWFKTNKTLINTGDNGLVNQAAVLSELRGREITSETIHQAIGRVSARTGLHFQVSDRPANPDPRRHQDDGTGFMQKEKPGKYRPDGRINHSYVDPADKKEVVSAQPIDAWESMCRSMLSFGAPAQSAAIRETFDKAQAKGKSWREIYSEMQQVRKNYERIQSAR